MRVLLASLFATLLIAGCSRDRPPTAPGPEPSEGDLSWVGTASGGDVLVAIHYVGTTITGHLVHGGPNVSLLSGTAVGDSLLLTVSSGGMLRARVSGTAAGDTLEGTIEITSGVGAGPLLAHLVPTEPATTLATIAEPFSVYNLAFDGSKLWCAGNDHIRVSLDGAILDTVIVYVRDAHWTATNAGWDGTRMWGVYPVTLVYPDHSEDVAELLGYDAQGRTGDSIYVAHRPAGLAWDGTALWSLRRDPPSLLRLDATGHVLDSLHVDLPDATKLAWDGSRFWVLSWYLERLCRLGPDGHVEAMYTLPHDASMLASGLVWDGNAFVVSESGLGTHSSRLHRVTPFSPLTMRARGTTPAAWRSPAR